ncbi:MAG: hypothetical protein NT069_00235 [Planctomycetota bacterium]|nr:hypothetical protein [Planctomycetota bacterium]
MDISMPKPPPKSAANHVLLAIMLSIAIPAVGRCDDSVDTVVSVLGRLADEALNNVVKGEFDSARQRLREAQRTVHINSANMNWRVARVCQFVRELESLLDAPSKELPKVRRLLTHFVNARNAGKSRHFGVVAWHAERALLDLASIESSTPGLQFTLSHYYLVAKNTLREQVDGPVTYNDFETLARMTWGDDSWQSGISLGLKIWNSSVCAADPDISIDDVQKARRLVAVTADKYSDDYSLFTWLFVTVLNANSRYAEAEKVCDTYLISLRDEQIAPPGDMTLVSGVLRNHGISLVRQKRANEARAAFDSARRNGFGRIPRREWVLQAVTAEFDACVSSVVTDRKAAAEWRVRKELAVSDGGIDAVLVAGNWIDTGLVSDNDVHRFTARLAFETATRQRLGNLKSSSSLGSLLPDTTVTHLESPEFDSEWLHHDFQRQVKKEARTVSKQSLEAIRWTWETRSAESKCIGRSFESVTDSANAIRTDFGATSASLWYYHRAVAKACRECGRFRDASDQLGLARRILVAAGKHRGSLGVVQSTEEMVAAALIGDNSIDPKKLVLAWEIDFPRTINCLSLRGQEAMAMGMNCIVGGDFAGAEAFGTRADFLCRHEHLQEYNGPDFTTPLAQAIRATAYAHYGETERAEKEFASMKLALEGGEGIRAPELRWFALKLYADFLEKEGKTARAKKIRQLSEAELPDRDGR